MGGSRIFLRRDAPLRNGVTDWRISVILERCISSQGVGVQALHPTPKFAADYFPS